ncbi:hypothetical protein F-S17_0150 [Faustovirus]|nr:hypothetical protein F-LCD7_0165 [Faustovirus]QJX71929.1 hypothetical protein F-M6_0166 [Faustovirus]QJX72416.1 hypothetical protein F-S17_0150 [Faustovirus]QJX72926.1 hypothetical protein F-VV57_0164 [Faustovirus]QJX73431.1 hypothetical protein F-VV63_0165 [Faustovirus]
MEQLEQRLKAAYYGSFEDNYKGIEQILIDATINDEIWLLWLPHKPMSNVIMQTYGKGKLKIESSYDWY